MRSSCSAASLVRPLGSVLYVQDEVGGWPGAADERLAGGGLFQRLRGVGDLSGEQLGGAGVADAGAAGSSGGDVAEFGHFEDAGHGMPTR